MALPYKDIFDPQINAKHRGICPSSWHIPSNAEWQKLVDFAGGDGVAGEKLKAKNGWNNNGNGTDDFGFSALPGGRYGGGLFGYTGSTGYWWSSTEINAYGNAYVWDMHNGSLDVFRGSFSKSSSLHSVRCVED
jgi:uncharacterized protein (TIGR02145 family)